MKVKKISVRPFEKGNLKGFATVITEDGFVLDGFTIVSGQNGLFVGWPQQLQKDGSYKDVTSIDNKEGRVELNNQILDTFKSEKSNPSVPSKATRPPGASPYRQNTTRKSKPAQEEKDNDEEIWS
jgi:DNA-binding cell septation regulator SpoVG